MSHIHNIEIKNFKSIRHATLKDCKRINVLVGPPNVGKSNILEAMSLFSITDKTEDLSDFIRLEDLTTLFYDGDVYQYAEVILDKVIRVRASYQENQVAAIIENDSKEYGFSIIDKDRHSSIHNRRASELGGYTFTRLSADGSIKKSGYKIGTYPLRYYNQDNNDKEHIEEEIKICKYEFRKRSSFSHVYNNKLELDHPFGENIFSIISTNSSLRNSIQKLFQPYGLELLYDARQQKFTILKRTGTGIFSIPYQLVADTLQRLIFYKTAIASSKEKVLLFEEPESHLYEPYILDITNTIKNDENNNQYFIVTHNQYFIDELLRDEQSRNNTSIYLIGLEEGETAVRWLDPKKSEDVFDSGLNIFFNYDNLWEENA